MSSKGKSSAKTGGGTALVPKLRFPEFQGADGWKEISLQKLARPVTDRATTGDADNVLSLSGEHGLVLQSDYFGKKIAGDSTDRYLKIRKDDFVYNDRTTKASSFGTIKRLSNYSGGIVSPIYKCFRFQPSENPVFWEWYFDSGSHDLALGGLVNEGARAGRFNISVSQFLSTNAWRPDEDEQQKIADCLDSVDALIAAQGRKVEVLRAYKKGLMQQLFPQEGETQPRLRFPEFEGAGEWEEHKMGDVCELYQPVTLSSSELTMTGEHLVYGANGVIGTHNEYNHADSEVAVTCRGATCGEVTRTRPMSWITGNAMVVRPRSGGLEKDFLFQYFKNHGLKSVISGSAQPQITRAGFSPLPVSFPAPAEQQRIADCLTALDDLIATETRKLDTLKTHKKGLMQQLFPHVGDPDA